MANTIQLGMLIAVIVYAVVTFKLWQAAVRTLAVVTQQLEITDRPWLAVEVHVAEPFKRNVDNVQLNLLVVVKNVGRSVATNIEVAIRMYPQPWGEGVFADPIKRQSELCDRERSRVASPGSSRLVLFPNEEATQAAGVTLTLSNAAEVAKTFPREMGEQVVMPVVVGCVDYQFGSSGRHHQTGFVYQVIRFDPARPFNALVFHLDQMDVPMTTFRLERFFFGGNYAD